MKCLHTVMVWTMLALWLPVTNHCRLEQMPGFGFLSCCQEGGNPQDGDCQTDGCDLLESGLYKTENNAIQVVVPVVAVVDFLAPLEEWDTGPEFAWRILDSAPPDFPKSWQFSFRAAAPPRAPSLAS